MEKEIESLKFDLHEKDAIIKRLDKEGRFVKFNNNNANLHTSPKNYGFDDQQS